MRRWIEAAIAFGIAAVVILVGASAGAAATPPTTSPSRAAAATSAPAPQPARAGRTSTVWAAMFSSDVAAGWPAMYLVRRSAGETPRDLHVFYRTDPPSLEGTLFEPLAGQLLIPAGFSSAALYIGTTPAIDVGGLGPPRSSSFDIQLIAPPEVLMTAPRPATRQSARPSAPTTRP